MPPLNDHRTAPINANLLRDYRHQQHLRLQDVARLLGVRSIAPLSAWEKGRAWPTLKNGLKLSAALKCPLEVLYGDYFRQVRKDMFNRRE